MPTENQLRTLQAVCDTVVPAIERPHDPHGFWRRTATDVGADQALVQMLGELPEDQSGPLLGLLDVLDAQGFATASAASREQILRSLALMSRDAGAGITALRSLTLLFTYGLIDPATGANPNWAQFGYAGPLSPPPDEPKTITPLTPADPHTTLSADVVVVGSGAGGGLIAGELARAGLAVVVVEAGGYYNEADFNQSEVWAYQNLYWRGGATPTTDQNVGLLAGSCLGGGTVVNWTNSIRTKPWVRREWAEEHGLTDVATDFDRHLDAVCGRIGVNGDCSDLNRVQQGMQRAAETLGWSFVRTSRNVDPARYDPATAGYIGFGDQSGAKQSTLKTYLQDAADHDARILVRCAVTRVLVENGRAAGVEATWTDPATGATAEVLVKAPRVVVAAGSLESPGVLLRSAIGGPAVGRHLRLHPCTVTTGTLGEDQQAWWGAPHAGIIDEFASGDDGYGFLVEGVHYTTGFAALGTPWLSGEHHKGLMADLGRGASLIGLVRDRGHGRVTIDQNGTAQPSYALTDPHDVATTRLALDAQIRVHEAAGADRIAVFAAHVPTWHRGDDLEAFIRSAQRVPLRGGAMSLFSAHQMGTCRMGTDPATSVADPRGELHDTPGVWIGDGSAFPTPSGTNPMITIMGLAHRTAEHIAADAGHSLAAPQHRDLQEIR
jgi:choline dehydrogenase-like flavoprotein